MNVHMVSAKNKRHGHMGCHVLTLHVCFWKPRHSGAKLAGTHGAPMSP